MMDAVASHLSEIGTKDWFVLVRVNVTEGRAVMVYEDGNDHELAQGVGCKSAFWVFLCKRSINRVPCVADSDVIGVGA